MTTCIVVGQGHICGPSVNPMVIALGLELRLGLGFWVMSHNIILEPLRDLVKTLLVQGKPRQTQICIYSLGRH